MSEYTAGSVTDGSVDSRNTFITNYTEEQPVNRWQIINANQSYNVAKCGRSSRWTTGSINAAPSCIRGTNIQVAFGEIQKDPVLTHAILHSDPSECFLRPGDSGSLVFLNCKDQMDAPLVGLAIGANPKSLVSYMAPIDLIFEDIKAVTGYDVIVPKMDGIAVGHDFNQEE